jgi:hypothetical protein
MNRVTSRLLVSILLVLWIAGCAASAGQQNAATPSDAATASGDEGSSFKRAVSLTDAKNEFEGVRAEHKWIQARYPGWNWDTQYLVNHEGRVYDMIEISRGSEHRQVYFDISNWFGKLE